MSTSVPVKMIRFTTYFHSLRMVISRSIFLGSNEGNINTLKYSFKARYDVSKKNENSTIITAITLGTKELENIDKILIESKNTIFELKL